MKRIINGILKKFGLQLTRANGIPATYKLLLNAHYFSSKFDLIKNIQGDVVECGVGFGHTLLLICQCSHIEGKQRQIWAFDSFEGFPEPSSEDTSFRNPKKGEWKVITPSDLDVDLYGSYKTCLNELYRKVVPGGVILFDEYKQKDTQQVFSGAAKAIDEFFADKAETIVYDQEHDKYYAITP
ncbi:MAG: hypothetical protein C4516_07945 [Oxalobacter sp.]|nr:MAG: hypothetical protein C4516_07945 [Oxalobacter sp.]